MFWTKILKSVIKILHSDISPRQMAGGIALGSIIGLTPFNALHNYFVFFLIMVLKVNIGAAVLSIAVFRLLAFLIDPAAHALGYLLLVEIKGLTPLWVYLYNLPVVPFTHFYNTVVLGSLVASLLLLVPVFLLSNKFIVYYRAHWRERVENTRIVKLIKLTSFYNLYNKFKGGE